MKYRNRSLSPLLAQQVCGTELICCHTFGSLTSKALSEIKLLGNHRRSGQLRYRSTTFRDNYILAFGQPCLDPRERSAKVPNRCCLHT